MPGFTQDNQNISLNTPLGKDALLLARLHGTERVSGLFDFNLELWSENKSISATDIVGKSVTVTVTGVDGKARYLNGVVRSFSAGVIREKLRQYRAEIVPWLWMLTQSSDCRIFQGADQTIPKIIEAVFGLHGFSDFRKSLTGTYPTFEYCVQYQESAFSFVHVPVDRELFLFKRCAHYPRRGFHATM